jgi:hypothetical protein
MDTEVIIALIALLGTFISVLASFIVNLKQYRSSKKQNELKEREIKIKERVFEITELKERLFKEEKKLNKLYIPLKKQLDTSYTFYKRFREGFPREFMALTYFLDETNRKELDKSKKLLFNQVLDSNNEIIKIIDRELGLLDEEFFAEYIPDPKYTEVEMKYNENILQVLRTHYKLMQSSYKGEFSKEDFDMVKNYIYPKEFNEILNRKIQQLRENVLEMNRKIEKLNELNKGEV